MSRAERFVLQDQLRTVARPRVAVCGLKRVRKTVQITREPSGGMGINGPGFCGSTWTCPRCAHCIASERADEVQEAVKRWKERSASNTLSMVTFTVRHALGDDLGFVRRGIQKAFRALWTGRGGAERRARLRRAHMIKALETTHGENGWHPHLHVVFFHDGEPNSEAIEELHEAWRVAVTRQIGPRYAPSREHGVDFSPLHEATYIAKLGLEVAAITTKEGRVGSRTPWQIAQDAGAGDEASMALWRTYSRAMHGARQLFWSPGLRKLLRLREELSDEQIAEATGVGYAIVEFDGAEWDRQARQYGWFARVAEAMAAGEDEVRALPGVALRAPFEPHYFDPHRVIRLEALSRDRWDKASVRVA